MAESSALYHFDPEKPRFWQGTMTCLDWSASIRADFQKSITMSKRQWCLVDSGNRL